MHHHSELGRCRRSDWDSPQDARLLVSLHVHEKGGPRGRHEHEKLVVPSVCYATSASIYDLAVAAMLTPEELQSTSHEIKTFLTKIDPWNSSATPRWIQIGDYGSTLAELDRSYPGFNAIKFLLIHEIPAPPEDTGLRSIHAVLAPAPTDRSHLPPKLTTARGKLASDRVMYNDIIDLCRQKAACFSKHAAVTKGHLLVSDLRDVLWGIDAHLGIMHARGQSDKEGNLKFGFPSLFKSLVGYSKFDERIRSTSTKAADYYGYDNWRRKQKGKPKLEQEGVTAHINKLAIMLERPHIKQDLPGWQLFRAACADLQTVLENWLQHLKDRCDGADGEQDPALTVATENDESRIIEASFCTLPKWASSLSARLNAIQPYQPLLANEYLGETSPQLGNYRLKHLRFPLAVKLYTHVHTGCSNLYFIWKLPKKAERTEQQNDQVIHQIREQFPFYSSRATRQKMSHMLAKLGGNRPLQATAARKLLQECFADASVQNLTQPERQSRLNRLTKAMEDGGDDIVLDLRQLNFRVDNPLFDQFWEWCATQFESGDSVAVDSRRGDGLRMSPMAKYPSAPALLPEAKKQLGEDVAIPSLRWLYFQFFPTNPHTHASSKHTGRLKIKLKIQSCILRAHHPDKNYCWSMWTYLREFLVMKREFASLQSCDEKKSIPVGEPGNYVQAVEKTRKIMCRIDGRWVALDHGWSKSNIVPSVVLQIEIPETLHGSWYAGTVCVILKEKTFGNTDAAMRHTVENQSVARFLNVATPITVSIHDGAADYNMTNGGALLAHLVDYIRSGADMAISMRFCPYQSYNDPAERCMSLLNMGLQGVALARTNVNPTMERFMTRCSSMKDTRSLAKDHPQIVSYVQESMEAPIKMVQDQFEKLEWTENSVHVLPPATNEMLQEAWDALHQIDSTLGRNSTLAKILASKEDLQEFLSTHTRQRTYMVQTMKVCKGKECKFGCKPLMMPENDFDQLHFIPDPVKAADGEWKPFHEVHGTETTEDDMPSKTAEGNPALDKEHSGLLTVGKARGYAKCSRCSKPRVIYSQRKKAHA